MDGNLVKQNQKLLKLHMTFSLCPFPVNQVDEISGKLQVYSWEEEDLKQLLNVRFLASLLAKGWEWGGGRLSISLLMLPSPIFLSFSPASLPLGSKFALLYTWPPS